MDQLIFEMRKTESSKYSAKTHKNSFYATIPNSSPASLSLAIYTKYNIILTYLLWLTRLTAFSRDICELSVSTFWLLSYTVLSAQVAAGVSAYVVDVSVLLTWNTPLLDPTVDTEHTCIANTQGNML